MANLEYKHNRCGNMVVFGSQSDGYWATCLACNEDVFSFETHYEDWGKNNG